MKINIDIIIDTNFLESVGLKEKVRDSTLLELLLPEINTDTIKWCIHQLNVLSASQTMSSRQVQSKLVIEIPDEKLIEVLENVQNGDRQLMESKG
jgi:rRNA-processing protein FCF1